MERVLIASFDAGEINEIPVNDKTVVTITQRDVIVASFELGGVTNLVLTEPMGLDNNLDRELAAMEETSC